MKGSSIGAPVQVEKTTTYTPRHKPSASHRVDDHPAHARDSRRVGLSGHHHDPTSPPWTPLWYGLTRAALTTIALVDNLAADRFEPAR